MKLNSNSLGAIIRIFLICIYVDINPAFRIPSHLYLQTCDLAAVMIDCLMFRILLIIIKKKKTFGEFFYHFNNATYFFGSLCCNKPQQDLSVSQPQVMTHLGYEVTVLVAYCIMSIPFLGSFSGNEGQCELEV